MRVVVVGGGIAGVGVAAMLATEPGVEVVLLESEPTLARHTTGRSAAQFLETYGGPVNQRLTIASRAFFTSPPPGFADSPLLARRPMLQVGGPDHVAGLTELVAAARAIVPSVRLVDEAEARAICPAIRPGVVTAGMFEPDAHDIDVPSLHQGFVRMLRSAGGTIRTSAPVTSLRRDGGTWRVGTPGSDGLEADALLEADAVVVAAGAWADRVGELAGADPIGLVPMRRTAFTIPAPADSEAWPLLYNLGDDEFYVKPEPGGQLLCSLADETPSEPCDARPEEADVALALDRIARVTTLDVRHVRTAWAGLRSFVGDRGPVLGADPSVPGLFWSAGQGGTGIQTAPAAAACLAALVLGRPLPPEVTALGVTAADLAPRTTPRPDPGGTP
ncbi:MAG: FAD-binding oxidoreductase [Acidimicrobiales bacterium]|nr:FAD-binding oxidoreductase [Acidimicrobiales bacterium]